MLLQVWLMHNEYTEQVLNLLQKENVFRQIVYRLRNLS